MGMLLMGFMRGVVALSLHMLQHGREIPNTVNT